MDGDTPMAPNHMNADGFSKKRNKNKIKNNNINSHGFGDGYFRPPRYLLFEGPTGSMLIRRALCPELFVAHLG